MLKKYNNVGVHEFIVMVYNKLRNYGPLLKVYKNPTFVCMSVWHININQIK